MMCGLFVITNEGMPTVEGYTTTISADGSTTMVKDIGKTNDFAIRTTAIVTSVLGAITGVLVFMEQLKENKYGQSIMVSVGS